MATGNILIRGEAGTGKGLLARFIHNSHRAEKEFISCSLPGIPDTLAEDMLFGHTRNAFTGAKSDRKGYFESAHNGTLFLDEVGDASPEIQAKLLRAIQDGEVQRLGADQPVKVDVRVISATNIDIEYKAAADAGFRQDFLDRLRTGGTIVLPPLRYRKEDIPLLAQKFVREAEDTIPGALRRDIDPEALDKLVNFDWPGNIRELRSCIVDAVQSYPDVEHLVPIHIKLPSQNLLSSKAMPATHQDTAPSASRTFPTSINIDVERIIKALSDFSFESAPPSQLAGKLPELQKAYAHLLADYLKAVLKIYSKPTLEQPDGKIFIQPTIKFMSGDQNLTAQKAADLIKRIFDIHPESLESLVSDPILEEAYKIALRIRPKQSGQKKK
jgi:transcriptional regulator with GAF, ATPase, and Fis domain